MRDGLFYTAVIFRFRPRIVFAKAPLSINRAALGDHFLWCQFLRSR